jgi:hypothetical protein
MRASGPGASRSNSHSSQCGLMEKAAWSAIRAVVCCVLLSQVFSH